MQASARDLQLQVGVGLGASHVTTLSAAGHRFFIVGGPEVALATEAAIAGIASKCQCEIVISTAVHQEVSSSLISICYQMTE